MDQLMYFGRAQKDDLSLDQFVAKYEVRSPVLVQTRGIEPTMEQMLGGKHLGFQTAAPRDVDYTNFMEYSLPFDVKVHRLEKRVQGGFEMFVSIGRSWKYVSIASVM